MKCARKKNTETNPKKSEAKKEAKTKNLTKKKTFQHAKRTNKIGRFYNLDGAAERETEEGLYKTGF